MIKQQAFVGGEWIDADSGARQKIRNPATGEVLGSVPICRGTETRRAITAAARGFQAWKKVTARERSLALERLATAIDHYAEELSVLLTLEQGKPLAEARGEIAFSKAYVRWFAGEAERIYGDVIPSPWADRRIIVEHQPVGVVGAITPWNFPSSMIARKLAPALAAGCSIIIKPAMQTPFSGLAWGHLAQEAGLPAGVVNVVTGDARTVGEELTTSEVVRKITFTGSTGVGRILAAQSAPSLKKLSMELGGNAPFIIFDDADIDRAVKGAINSKFRNAGQTCVCTNRIYVQAGIYDAFATKFRHALAQMTVGNGLDESVDIGPLIDDRAVLKTEEHVQDAVLKGGQILIGGQRDARGSNFFQPTIITGATDKMLVASEETFGPLAPLFSFEAEEEVIEAANRTEYGLAAYIYTQNLSRAFRVAEALECGMVGINEGLITTEVAPFGGVKQSGFGREGSRYGILDYIETKYLCVGL